ncbi:hypothetical protein ADM99_14970 [Leptolinea tardivitalis]|uniref:Uncharacterized protein n=1 Tax=Leptolinea tardivitalis TaxID=229920 RepID=A0A0P6WV22_9CHLR|nr:hypothetical protein ADM99_14970 [Leptolinea tardivitalis]GAP22024.1 hypothetical protein LTAR_02242 [Leptolinea tardivitalis]
MSTLTNPDRNRPKFSHRNPLPKREGVLSPEEGCVGCKRAIPHSVGADGRPPLRVMGYPQIKICHPVFPPKRNIPLIGSSRMQHAHRVFRLVSEIARVDGRPPLRVMDYPQTKICHPIFPSVKSASAKNALAKGK